MVHSAATLRRKCTACLLIIASFSDRNCVLPGWNAVIDTNLTGTFFMSQAVFNSSMRDHAPSAVGGCAIVNIIAMIHNGFPGTQSFLSSTFARIMI
jgi:NAD(P)-dependent dehydrogenase (short-subunit alcohol dehydrogenase family)